MLISEFLDRDGVMLRAAGSKRHALSQLAEAAGRRLGVDPHAALDRLTERERAGSTGVGGGVALPHARLRGLQRVHAVFVRLDAPVDFDAVDDKPVDLIFALLAPEETAGEHLRALACVSRLLRREDLRAQLRAAPTPDALFSLLTGEARPTAA